MSPHFLRGQILLQQRRYPEAAAEFRRALQDEPDNALLHTLMGNALLQSGRTQQALESVKTAIGKDPSSALAFFFLTLVHLERNELKEAESAIQSAIQLQPDAADYHGLLARIHVERRRFQEALLAAEAGLALDPKDDLCLTFRSRALMGLGREAEARRDADALLADDPNDAWNHCLRGDQWIAAGEHAKAREHYLEALRLDPRNPSARYGLAVSLKARSPIYSMLLRGLLQFDRFRGWAVWLILILFAITLKAGNAWTRAHPDWLVPYEAALVLFWGATILIFIANPVFDLLLRFDRENRHVLTDDEVKATNWYLACFAFAALCGVWAFLGKTSLLPRTLGITAFYFTRAVSEVYESTPGYVRRRMAAITIFAAACLVLTPVILLVGLVLMLWTRQTQAISLFVPAALGIPIAVILFTTVVDHIRLHFENRRPDKP